MLQVQVLMKILIYVIFHIYNVLIFFNLNLINSINFINQFIINIINIFNFNICCCVVAEYYCKGFLDCHLAVLLSAVFEIDVVDKNYQLSLTYFELA